MKHIYILLLLLFAFAPAMYAVNDGNTVKLSMAPAADITVVGRIVGENGSTLPGANVSQKGTTNGTITDFDGNFSLTVPSDATLVIAFMGYNSIEVPVNGKTNLGDIALEMAFEQLEQVVVVGYGTQRKVDLTGSVAVVDAAEMKKVSNSNISTMLQGKVSGVQITSDGQPGADPSVRIRGIGSFGNSSPLYVIDGVPMGTTIRDFSPNDIESLQVLKDASAAAIYGSRAANGVVIITTKQGKKEQPLKVDFNTYVGFDQVRGGVYDVMDSKEYSQYVTTAFNNSGMDVPNGYNPASADYFDPTNPNKWVDTNWFDEVFKTGVRQNHNINFSGGGANNTYNVALDYFSQEGTMEGAGPNFDRYTARINNTMDVKFIKIRTSVVYSHSDQDNMALSNANEYVQGLYGSQFPVMVSALLLPPTIKAYDESTWVLDDKLASAKEYNYDSFGYGTYYDDIHGDLRVSNVLLTNQLLERRSSVDRIVGSGSVNVDLLDMVGKANSNHKFDYKLNMSYSKTTAKDFTFVPSFIQSTANYLSKNNEDLTQAYRSYNDILIENTLNYDGTFGRSHVNALVGQTFQSGFHHRLDGTGINMPEPYYLQIKNAKETQASSYEELSKIASYIGRINYNFDDRYLLSATVRHDASTRLSDDVTTSEVERAEWFPSVSAGWRVERESFFPEAAKTAVSLLKFRGSYGELGNTANLGPYDYMDVMARGDYTYSFGNEKVTGSSISNYVNTAIRWEKKKTLDFGLDLALFDNQLEFTFDWYKSTSENLHYDVAVPLNAGVTNDVVKMNASTMVNSGLEFLVAYHNHENVLKYDISINVSTLNNEVTKLGVANEPRTDGLGRTEVGREVGSFYGYVADGLFQSAEEIDNNVNDEGLPVVQVAAKPGDVRYKDINNDGQITNEDQEFLGSGIPSVNFGFNARLEWNGFDLSISTFGAAGFKAVDFADMTLRSSYGALNKSTDLLNAWTPENTNTDVPRVDYKTSGSPNDRFSQRFIQDASYLKIANVMLGYNLPDKWFKGYTRGVRLYVSGQNLGVISKYKGYNVDFAGGTFTPGYNYASYPTPRTIMFGAHLTF